MGKDRTLEIIKTEIERRMKELDEQIVDIYDSKAVLRKDELQKSLSFLSDLEKSLPAKITDGEVLEWEINRTYHEGSVADTWDIDHVTYENIAEYFYELGCHRTAEKYDEIEYNRQRAEESENPMNLEEEINRYLREVCSDDDEPGIHEIAHHFAQWGAKHAKEKMRNARRTEEAYQEVAKDMRKQIDGSLEIPKDARIAAEQFYPQDCFDSQAVRELGINCFVDGAKWGAEHPSGSSEIPNDLEEAAGSKLDDFDAVAYMGNMEEGQSPLYDMQQMLAMFIAGAKWQAEQLLKSSPLPEDTVLFNKGVEEGKRLMMEDAVEGFVENWSPEPHPEITIPLNPEEYSNGDKVRIIVLKKED